MEIRDFATAVLTGTRIEDKLIAIDRITDERPGRALTSPMEPGRPHGLTFSDSRAKPPFPKLSMLDDEKVRKTNPTDSN